MNFSFKNRIVYLSKCVFESYIHAHLHTAVAVCMLVGTTGFLIGKNTLPLGIFVGLSTLLCYNAIVFLKIKKYKKHRTRYWIEKKFTIFLCINFLGLFFWGYLLFQLPFLKVFKILLLPFLITFFYMIPIQWQGKKYDLRHIPFVKIYAIAGAWGWVGAFLPLEIFNINLHINYLYLFVQQFFFVMVLCLSFDVRDLEIDDKNLKTIPQILGIQKTKITGVLLAGISFVCAVRLWADLYFWGLLCTYILLAGSVLFSDKKVKYYCSFWVESVPIFYYLFLFFARWI